MAIGTGVTVTRELSSKTQSGLSKSISKAFSSDETFGISSDGEKLFNKNNVAVNQKSTVLFKWRSTKLETKQTFIVNGDGMNTALGFAGVTGVKKVERVTISIGGSQTSNFGSDPKFISFDFAGRTITQTLVPSTATLDDITDAMVVALENQPEVVGILEVSDTVLEITYSLEAGNVSVGSELEVKYNNGNFGRRFTLTGDIRTAAVVESPAATLTMEIVKNVGQSGADTIEFPVSRAVSIIEASKGLLWWNFANQFTGLLDGSPDTGPHTAGARGNYKIPVNSGHACSALTIRATVSIAGRSDQTFDMVAIITDPELIPDTVTYVAPEPESYGTLLIRVVNPEDLRAHVVSVTVPENAPITDIEDRIKRAFGETVIGQNSNGEDEYVSSFVTPSTPSTPPTKSTDFGGRDTHDFTVDLAWTVEGPAGLPVVDATGMVDVDTSDPVSNFSTVATGTTGVAGADLVIPWKFVSTSATLQPGGETTHYATLVYTGI